MPAPPNSSSTVIPCRPSLPILGQSWRGKTSVRSISAANGAISASAKPRTVSRSISISEPRSKSNAGLRFRAMAPPLNGSLTGHYIAARTPASRDGRAPVPVQRHDWQPSPQGVFTVTSHRLTIPAFALLVGLGGLTAAAPAFAQAVTPAPDTAAPAPAATTPAHEHHHSAEQFVAGRIAFLKAELKITPQQEAQWNKVAEAMRVNAKAIDATRAQKAEGPQTAVQALRSEERRVGRE